MRSRLAIALGSLAIASVASVSAAQVTTTYTYDPQGQVKTVARPSGAVAYTYDAAGNRTALNIVYPPPGAGAGSLSVPFGGSASLALPVSGPFTGATVEAAPTKGSVSISGTTATYTAGVNSYGADSFTYHAVGPGGNSAVQTITVSIANPPAPIAGNGAMNVPYNSAANETVPTAGVVTSWAVATAPTKGTVTKTTGLGFTYTATSGAYGADSFTFYASGPGGNSSPGTVSVTIANPSAPTAANTSLSVAYNGADATVALPVGGVVTGATIVMAPAHGYYAVTGTTAHYTPYTGYYGPDSFNYVANGPGGNSAPATVSVTVGNPPAPTAANTSLSVAYNGADATVALPVGGVVAGATIVTAPAHGYYAVTGTTAHYTPYTGYYGPDSFNYVASGPGGASAPATVSVSVGLPPAPTAGAVSTTTAFNTPKAIGLSPSGIYSSLAVASGPAHGWASISGTTATYTPNGLYSGPDSFTYTATGPGGTSAPATVSVTVGAPPPNNPPTAVNDGTVQIVAGDTVNVNVTANDSDPDGDTLSIVSLSKTTSTKADYAFSGGTITVMAKSSKGGDSLTYTITDGKGGTATATLSINVTF
ncbi:hypothetical protein ASD38_23005 [Caulobacter sp. Root487D2Y]|nr:hypothetical protein ASD38_23005 [Caulobacter sp. Root487D2Y]